MKWIGGLAEWAEGDTDYISVAFSYKVPEAVDRAIFAKHQGLKVKVGGPALFVPSLAKRFEGIAEVGGKYPDAVIHHNPNATFASKGCPVGCWFCLVPTIEGKEFTLLPDFPVRPVLCDSNLSALPAKYQEHIISRYKKEGVPLLDCCQGFEPITFTEDVFNRWKEINQGPWRFAFDETKEAPQVRRVFKMLAGETNRRKKRVYCLIGNEPFQACMDRLNEIIANNCDPHVQPFIPLNSLAREPLAKFDWTVQLLKDVARWANAFLYRTVSFKDYNRSRKNQIEVYDESQGLFTFV